MRRILVTGATGFIGGHLLRQLLPCYDVIALGRNRPMGDAAATTEWVEQDLAQPLDARRLPGQVDAIIHLAQSQVYKQFPQRAKDIFAVNVNGTFRLLDYAREVGIGQFIFASSGGIYRYSDAKISETDPILPLSFYLSSKYAAEVLMRNYESIFPTTILRFFFVYGPGQQAGMLIPSFAHRIQNNERITIESDPGLRINPIYVADAARAIEASLRLDISGPFNVAGDETVTMTDLVNLIAHVTGTEANTRHTTTASAGDLVADTTRMKQLLGVQPEVTLVEGLRRTFAP